MNFVSRQSPRLIVNLLTIFACSLVASNLKADEKTSSINTYAKAPDDDSPNQSQTTISLDQSKLNFNELSDELDKVPGLSTQESGLGQASYAAIRGGNPRQNRVRWNGLKLSLPFGPGFDFSSLDSLAFDSLTVLRSGSSATKGSGALTGAIELNSRPRFDGKYFSANTAYGSFGTLNLGLKSGIREEDNYLVFSFGLRRSEGNFKFIDRQDEPHIRVANESERLQASASLGRRISEKWTNELSILSSQLDRKSPGPSEFQDQFINAKNEISQVHVSNRLVGKKLSGFSSDDSEAKFLFGFSGSTFSYNNPTSFLGNGSFDSQSTHRRGSASSSYRFFTEDSRTTLHLGTSFETYQTQLRKSGKPSERNKHERVELSLRGAFEWYWSDSFISFLNGAIDRIDGEILPTFNLASAFFIDEKWSLRVNGARSSRAPDLDELYLETENLRGNDEVEIESAWTADLSLNFDHKAFHFESTFFASLIENTILFLPVSAFLIEANNVSAFPSLGLENTVGLHLEHLSINATYTLSSARRSGIQAPHQPLHQGRLAARFGTKIRKGWIDSARIFASANARSAINLDLFGSIKNDASLRLNFGIGTQLRIGKELKVDLSLGAKNLLDDQKQSDFLQRPLPGRQVYGSMILTL